MSVPEWLTEVTDITTLSLTGNGLTALPESIGNLSALTELHMGHNRLTALPESIGNLTALTTLHLHGNRLTTLPESIGNLTALTELYLSGNRLTALPESIGNLTALTTLNLGGNQLTALPESIGNLTALTTLNLGGNQLTALPESIGNLTKLKDLNLVNHQLTALPESIGNLIAFTALDLTGNQLTALPESIGNLIALTALDLTGNQLTALPESIGNLTALTELYLSGNRLTALPESIGNLTKLKDLNLVNHQLTALPESIGNLIALTTLDLTGNQLTILPKHLADLLTGRLNLKLAGNPLDDPLPEIVNRGSDALAAYLRSLEDAIAVYEAKLLLIGEGSVGKTSLVAALRGAPFVDGRPTTHGIEISPLTLRHPTLKVDMTLRAWDFGGQEVYRVSHQFFYSRRALYVVVWNAREGQEQDQVAGWLSRIRVRVGRDARVMVVATHCAERLPDLDYPQLEQTFPNVLVGNYEIDSRTEAGLPELREAISQQGAKLLPMGQRISPRWVAARDEILAQAQVEPQILYEEFAIICERHEVIGQEILTLAELMHDLGHIIYYSEDEGLKDIVVLNPEWLTRAVSYVLEDKPTREAGGVLDHARLRGIWQDRHDGPVYHIRYHRYFLRLMEKFDISYRLEGDELHSLVAQLVPHRRPILPWQLDTQPAAGIRVLALVCRLSEPAPGLIPWLTVRHHRASTGMHWRRGIFLRHPIAAYSSEALLELRNDSELALEVRSPSPDLYFNVLRDSIEDLLGRRWPGLTYELLIPCPVINRDETACTGEFPLNTLLKWREHNIAEAPCSKCSEVHEISRLLTGFAVRQPIGVELKQMRNQLARIENGLSRMEDHAAEISEAVRRVLRVVSAEVTDCPRLFTLVRVEGRRKSLHQHQYHLTLWCEHPGYWHRWMPASYDLHVPKGWFAQIRPYAVLVFRTLQLVVPLVASIGGVVLSPDQLSHTKGDLDLMKTLVAELPSDLDQDQGAIGLGETMGRLTPAQNEALRAIRTVLFEHDQARTFGRLRRVLAPSGDFLWVCPDHYPEYDPGLPTVP